MVQTCLLAACALAIVLYLQARLSAREIRRNRTRSDLPHARHLTLGPDTATR